MAGAIGISLHYDRCFISDSPITCHLCSNNKRRRVNLVITITSNKTLLQHTEIVTIFFFLECCIRIVVSIAYLLWKTFLGCMEG